MRAYWVTVLRAQIYIMQIILIIFLITVFD
jgi:hypothetical protein